MKILYNLTPFTFDSHSLKFGSTSKGQLILTSTITYKNCLDENYKNENSFFSSEEEEEEATMNANISNHGHEPLDTKFQNRIVVREKGYWTG